MRFLFLFLGLAGAIDFVAEHPGQLFSKITNPSCLSGVLTNGSSTGQTRNISGINTYVAHPLSNQTDTALLYLTDIFGLPLVNNRLLGDSFTKAGYFVVMPDMFNGDAIPIDYLTNGFNMTAWYARHTDAAVDSIVESTIRYMRSIGVKKLGAVGYCFGGRFITRFLAPGKGIDVGFTAHPAGVLTAEWQAVSKPFSIAFGALDVLNNATQRATAEAILESKNLTYQTSLYAGAPHGFAVRADLSDPRQSFAQEAAYFQAVRWLDTWLNTAKAMIIV